MKKWFLGLLTGIFLMSVLLVAAGFLGWYLRQRPPEVLPNTFLVLDLHGEIPEQAPSDLPGQIFSAGEPMTFLPLIREIQKAAADSRIAGILLQPSDLQFGWGKLEQLRQTLQEFRQRGKKVIALLGTAGSREYFLASVADRIVLSPVGFLDLKGMRAEVMFFRDALGKLGIVADLEHIGPYKNFSDQFTEQRMSEAFREATTSLLDGIYENFLRTVAAGRRRTLEEMRTTMEQNGPFEAERALQFGLVDQLQYEDEVFGQMEKESGKKPNRMTMADYNRVPREAVGLRGGARVALLYAVGTITSGEDGFDPVFSGKTLGSETFASVVDQLAEDQAVKGVILRIDSPGGDAFASDEIWRSLIELRQKKPMVVSMSDTAASGGYYIAATGDPIVAEAGTLTGSIGIIYGKLNLKGLYDKVGISKEIISRGKFSAMDSDSRAYTPEERERVRELMNDFYRKFLAKVSTARKMPVEAVDRLAQGRVWTGQQAKQNGLVDELGGLDKALEILKKKAGIPAREAVELVEYPQRKSLLELLLSRAQGGREEAAAPLLRLAQSLLKGNPGGTLFPSPLWARMPYSVDFR